MTALTDYVDVRTALTGYKRASCPTCGEVRWTKPDDSYGRDKGPVCTSCHQFLRESLEVPCPECLTKMRALHGAGGDRWGCANCEATRGLPKSTLIDRLSGDDHFVRGMPGMMMGECPVCGADSSVNGTPDGDLRCDECHFYAGQYGSRWYAYAHWLAGEHDVRVREEGAL